MPFRDEFSSAWRRCQDRAGRLGDGKQDARCGRDGVAKGPVSCLCHHRHADVIGFAFCHLIPRAHACGVAFAFLCAFCLSTSLLLPAVRTACSWLHRNLGTGINDRESLLTFDYPPHSPRILRVEHNMARSTITWLRAAAVAALATQALAQTCCRLSLMQAAAFTDTARLPQWQGCTRY
jgi:hypothetical protein